MNKKLFSFAALALLTSACGMMLPPGMLAGGGGSGKAAQNPLVSGGSLENKTNARDVHGVSANDCTIWPFEDTIAVTASEAEFCVSARKIKEAPPGWTGEPTGNSSEGISISSDDGKATSYVNAEKTAASKLGSCFNKGYNQSIDIWAFDYKGCTKNEGTLTKSSTWLKVGDDQWSFPPPAPASSSSAGKTAAR
jgi:hypothetical protein